VERAKLFRYYCFAKQTLKSKGRSMYILSYSYTLEHLKNYELHVEPSEDMGEFFRKSGQDPQSPIPYRI
jgi:hypothetical protein